MLEAENVSVFYGNHRALEEASVKIDNNEIVVMLGANGAGKSTFLNAISGLASVSGDSKISMDGFDITGKSPEEIVEAGIALVPEDRGIFADLSVRENLLLGAYSKRARPHQSENLDRVLTLFPRLGERQNQTVRTMSGGERQMVAIGRAMMSHPSILMLDEPSLGLSPILCTELFRSLRDVKNTGVGIFLVEQNAKQSLKLADRGYLLDNGRITGADTAAALSNDKAVISAYLGGTDKTVGKAENIVTQIPETQHEFMETRKAQGINDFTLKAGHLGTARAQVENVLPLSISEMVKRATHRQVEHIDTLRQNNSGVERYRTVRNDAASNGSLNGDNASTDPEINIPAEPGLDSLQEMLIQMEKAASNALSGGKS